MFSLDFVNTFDKNITLTNGNKPIKRDFDFEKEKLQIRVKRVREFTKSNSVATRSGAFTQNGIQFRA